MSDRQEEQSIDELAARADPLIDRRSMIARSGRRIALPILISLCVSREAMGQSGSGGGGGDGGSRKFSDCAGGTDNYRRSDRSTWGRFWRRIWNSIR